MSQVITNAFEQYWQSSLAAEQPVVLDEFVLADIPNLDTTSPIDPDTGLPPASQIVYRQDVDQRGRINNNAVAYSIVMDTTVGDFSFNAMYLRNKANGVIGMIVYKGRETKTKTEQTTGQTGNSLVKSMLMGYDQAAAATVTQVDAGTWQIDYAARLRGQDEDLRQLASQLYGHHTFIADGFKVVEQAGAYQVTQGVAIVGGLRIELTQPEVIYPGSKPIGVWVDVYRSGSLLSEHQNHFTIITSVADLTDHLDGNGYQHYVAQLATVQADNTVVDGRGQGGSSGTGGIPDTLALWVRSMAEAGYTVTGSFERGGIVTSTTDVLIFEAKGAAYNWNSTFPVDGKVVPPKSTPNNTGGIGQNLWLLKNDASLRWQLAGPNGSAYIGGLPLDSLYGDMSTSEDNTEAANEKLNWSRTTGKTVEFPAGRFPVAGQLELGGVKARGRSIGYRNSDGTVLVGNGANTMFNQSTSAFPYYAAAKLESFRIENVVCGLEFGYLNRAEFEDVHIQSVGTSIRFGRAANSGPQWNIMRRCTAESVGGSALYMNGAAWCNNNTFETCFFESKQNGLNPCIVITAAGGFGAIGNVFIGTEFSSEGYGVRLLNARATELIGSYMECYGPAIWLNGTSVATKVVGGVFARQRNAANGNLTEVPWAIYHESGNASISIEKPYIVVSNPAEQDGCGFIGYAGAAVSSSFVVDVMADPVTENVGGVDYTRYQDGLFEKIVLIKHGDMVVQSNSSPSLSLQHEDGTKKLELYSNSIKGGSDYGGVLKINDIARMQFVGTDKILLPAGQKLGLTAEANVNAPGAKTHRIQILDESGNFRGFLAVYSS